MKAQIIFEHLYQCQYLTVSRRTPEACEVFLDCIQFVLCFEVHVCIFACPLRYYLIGMQVC